MHLGDLIVQVCGTQVGLPKIKACQNLLWHSQVRVSQESDSEHFVNGFF